MELTIDFLEIKNKVFKVLTKPYAFFASVKKEKGLRDPFVYTLVVSSIVLVLGTALNVFESGNTIQLIPALFFSYVVTILLGFLFSFFLKLWISLFGGKGDYSTAYKLYIYTSTPSVIFGWIPFLNIVVPIYSFVLLVVGLETLYKFSRQKAAITIALGMLVMLVLSAIILFVTSLVAFS